MGKVNNRRFYNASEAREMTKINIEEYHEIELQKIFDKIDSYVMAGEYECPIISLSDFQKNWLLNNGYEICEISGTNTWKDGLIKISWENGRIY